MSNIEIAVTGHNIDAITELTQHLGGTLYVDERPDTKPLPFRAMGTVVTDDMTAAHAAADVGLYVVYRRTVKAGEAGAISLLPFVHPQGVTHTEADQHWRDRHAPLALEHHPHMTHYTQLSVLATLSGPTYNAIAMCGFANADDLRHRFYRDEASVGIIANDVRHFADTKQSPRPLIAQMRQF